MHVQLYGTDIVDGRALAVDFDADAIEGDGKVVAGKIGGLPDSRGCGKAATVDGNPGAAFDAGGAANVVGDAGDDGFQDYGELDARAFWPPTVTTTGRLPAVTVKGLPGATAAMGTVTTADCSVCPFTCFVT